eukprot:1302248-Pleurochrysis_carterae.AAC.1
MSAHARLGAGVMCGRMRVWAHACVGACVRVYVCASGFVCAARLHFVARGVRPLGVGVGHRRSGALRAA